MNIDMVSTNNDNNNNNNDTCNILQQSEIRIVWTNQFIKSESESDSDSDLVKIYIVLNICLSDQILIVFEI